MACLLDMPFYVFNFTERFRTQVIDRFVQSYEEGRTPNPCIDCNRYMKFDKLYERAKLMGCEYIVTGHYARIEKEDGKFFLKKALDETQDQTYVLYTLTQDQLAHTMFPLGDLTKRTVRNIAEKNGFINANKPDSQDICFVPDGDYASVIEKYTGRICMPGNFVDTEGNIMGRHKGIIHYTLGQRKGLGIAAGKPVYVCEIRPQTREVVLGNPEDLMSRDVYVSDFNWISGNAPGGRIRCTAKVRYRQSEQPAVLSVEGDIVHIVFDQPQRAITPGQAAVVYDGDVVLGGGTII